MHILYYHKNMTFFFRPICYPRDNLTCGLNINNNTLDKWKLNIEMKDKFCDTREIYMYMRDAFSRYKVVRETNLQLRLQMKHQFAHERTALTRRVCLFVCRR